MPRSIPLLLSAGALLALSAHAKQCVQFDINGNLYAFGGDNDVSLGTSTSWAQPNVTPLSSTGRPPWTGNNTRCLLSQYNNALYVLDGDSSNPSNVYIYDFAGKTWATQQTSSPPDLSTGSSVLDHDTNVIYTLPASSSLYSLDFSAVKATSTGSAIAWNSVSQPSFTTTGYNPVMAEASNHIHFFDVPNTPAGSADIFVIHYSYFQPNAQSYPTTGGGSSFPDSPGQAFSIPQENDTPYQMVFVPDSFDNTYVVTAWVSPSSYNQTSDAPSGINDYLNTTQTLPAPSSKDTASSYAAWTNSIVQLDSSGNIYYLTNAVEQGSGFGVSTSATWTKMGYTISGLSGSGNSTSSASSTASGSATGSASSGASASRSATSSGASSAASSSGTSAASSQHGLPGQAVVLGLGAVAAMIGGALSLF